MKTNNKIIGAGLLTAIVASLCCITPVLALIAGASGLASTFSWLEPARPYFIGLTILVLGFAWYQKLKTLKQFNCNCESDYKPEFVQTKMFLGGIIGTAIMTLVMFVAPMLGMPKMSPPEMLAGMLGMPVFVGWLMHFMIGIMFAFAYTYLCIFKRKISNVYLKGAVFGVIVFVFAQIIMAIMGAMMPMPKMEGSMMLTIIGSLMGHIIFGMAVAKTIGNAYCDDKSCATESA